MVKTPDQKMGIIVTHLIADLHHHLTPHHQEGIVPLMAMNVDALVHRHPHIRHLRDVLV